MKRLLPLVTLVACIDLTLPPMDLEGPELLSVAPATADPLPLDPSIRLTFNEPVARPTIEPYVGSTSGTVLLMTRYKLDGDGRPELDENGQPESNLTAAMITDLNAGDGGLDAASYHARTVPSRVTLLEDDTTVLIQPMQRLRSNTDYMVVLSSMIRDAAGNRLGSPPTPEQERDGGLPHTVRVYHSAEGPPAIIGADLPGHTSELPGGGVPTNRSRIRLEFDRAMQGVSDGDVRLVLGDNLASVNLAASVNGTMLQVDLPTLSSAASHRNRCLEADATWTLCPSSSYQVVVENMRDTEDNVMERNSVSFTSATEPDTTAPALIGVVEVLAGEQEVQVRWQTDEPSSSEVVILGNPDRSVFGVACSASPCDHEVVVDGLSLGQGIEFFVRSKDLALNSFEGDNVQATTVDLPDLAITEVLAASGQDPDNSGEYLELHNYGQDVIDVEGWVLQRVGSSSSITLPAGTSVASGGFLVVVGSGFNAGHFPGLGEASLLRTTSSKLFSFGLSNSDLTVALLDDQGRTLSQTPRLVSSTGLSKTRERLDSDTFCNATPSPAAWTANSCP